MKYFLKFILFLFIYNNLIAQNIKLSGYTNVIQRLTFPNNFDSVISGGLIHNRLNFKFKPYETLEGALEIRNRFYFGEDIKAINNFGKSLKEQEDLINLSWLWLDKSSMVGISQIDRLWLNWNKKNFNIRVGRQRINWSMNLIWNPNDLFNSYNFLDYDYIEKKGVDALRIQYYTGLLSNIEFSYKPGNNEKRILATRYLFNKWQYDFQMFAGLYHTEPVFGGGWAGNAGNAGFKGEVTYFLKKNDNPESENVFNFSSSVDYSLSNGIYLSGTFMYNSLASNDINAFSNTGAYGQSAKILLPVKTAFLSQVSYSFNPIISGILMVMYAPSFNGIIFFPNINIYLNDNWESNFFMQNFWGDDSGVYKCLGTVFFCKLNWTF